MTHLKIISNYCFRFNCLIGDDTLNYLNTVLNLNLTNISKNLREGILQNIKV